MNYKIFELLIKNDIKTTKEDFINLNVDGLIYLQLTEKIVKVINKRFNHVIATKRSITIRAPRKLSKLNL